MHMLKTKLVLIAAGAFATVQPLWAEDVPPAAETNGSEVAAPAQPAPAEAPPPPAVRLPPPPTQPDQVNAEPPPEAPAGQPPDGQWTFTQQYGWVWTPYAQNYTYVAPDGGTAFTYAYYPNYGWRWLPSPWVLGWGPRPYWGRYGNARFAWSAHPWFHRGVYRPEVWTRWGRGYGHGYVYSRSYDRVAPRARYGRTVVAHPHGGGGEHRRR
jgi:hypothetical protein